MGHHHYHHLFVAGQGSAAFEHGSATPIPRSWRSSMERSHRRRNSSSSTLHHRPSTASTAPMPTAARSAHCRRCRRPPSPANTSSLASPTRCACLLPRWLAVLESSPALAGCRPRQFQAMLSSGCSAYAGPATHPPLNRCRCVQTEVVLPPLTGRQLYEVKPDGSIGKPSLMCGLVHDHPAEGLAAAGAAMPSCAHGPAAAGFAHMHACCPLPIAARPKQTSRASCWRCTGSWQPTWWSC